MMMTWHSLSLTATFPWARPATTTTFPWSRPPTLPHTDRSAVAHLSCVQLICRSSFFQPNVHIPFCQGTLDLVLLHRPQQQHHTSRIVFQWLYSLTMCRRGLMLGLMAILLDTRRYSRSGRPPQTSTLNSIHLFNF